MGIRFYCQNGHKLHVKSFLAGKTGICPECGVRVEIPTESVNLAPTRPQVDGLAPLVSQERKENVSTRVGDKEDQWFVRTGNGEQYGPATREVFESWISGGRVSGDCLVWHEGWDEWRPASSILSKHQQVPPPHPEPTGLPTPTQNPHFNEIENIEIEPVVPPRRNAKRRSLTLVYVLLAACLLLLFPLIYVVTVKS